MLILLDVAETHVYVSVATLEMQENALFKMSCQMPTPMIHGWRHLPLLLISTSQKHELSRERYILF